MKHSFFCLLFVFTAFIGCGRPTQHDMELGDKEASILIDYLVAEDLCNKIPEGPQRDSVLDVYLDKICVIHGVDKDSISELLQGSVSSLKHQEEILHELQARIDTLSLGEIKAE